MSIFDRLDRMASRTIDRVNGERFRLIPMARTPNGRPSPDTSRQTITGTGVFDYQSTMTGVELGNRSISRGDNDLRNLVTGREPQLSINRSFFPELKDEPVQGDQVEILDRPDLPPFTVIMTERDGQSRLVVRLVHEGRQT